MGVPFNRDSLLDQINAVLERQPQLNLFNIGQLISAMDLSASLSEIPLSQLAACPHQQYSSTRVISPWLKA